MSLSWRKVAAGVVGLGLMIGSVTACSSTRDAGTDASASGTAAAGDTLIGIAMPTKSLERWNRDGAHLEELLKADGFQTSLQYADNKVDQ
ncbi:MAG: ABC transporter substrate-binding protein, partial [Cellulomonas sp.]|nr:ABC transporter substrate-binding protein [Cellulomonas sp.]